VQVSHGDPRARGVVYTPPEVTGPMTRVALEPLLRGRSIEEILALRICDPAIGEGAFLLAAVAAVAEHLMRAGMAPEAARAGAAGCVYGVDVDPRAVEAARIAVGVGAGQLQVADALGLAWPAAFPEVFARGGFDAVIGNPPYIRQEYLAAHKPLLRAFASYDGVADLYVYFIELVHRLARPGGRYCLITPNKWLTAAYGRALRAHLSAQHSVEGVVDLGRTPLFGSADAFPCIVWGTIGGPRDAAIQAARLPAGAALALDEVGTPHPRERWRAAPWHIDAPDDRPLIDRIEARWPRLRDVIADRPSRGVVTGCNRAFVLDRAARDRLIAAEPAAAALIRPFVKGRDLRRWLPAAAERWILLVDRGVSLDELPQLAAHFEHYRSALEPRPAGWTGAWTGRKPGPYRWHELQDPVGALIKSRAPRLLYQDIQSGPACSLDRDGDVVPDTTVWMLPSADLVLLAVLNSPLYGWYAARRFPPALNGSVRPKLAYISQLPIAVPDAVQRATIERLVQHRLELEPRLRAEPDAAGEAAALDATIADAVHDVYELSAGERALVTRPDRG
jgi:hypothetical protein